MRLQSFSVHVILCKLCVGFIIKQIFYWGKSDLDHILVEGDCLYKSLGTLEMLSVDQLPGFVKMFSHNIPVRYVRLETQLATLTFGD